MLLYNMHKLLPSPEHNSVLAEDANGEPVELTCAEADPTVAYVFKTVADPFVGKLSYLRVVSGKITAGASLSTPAPARPRRWASPSRFWARSRRRPRASVPVTSALWQSWSAQRPATPSATLPAWSSCRTRLPEAQPVHAVTVAKKGDEARSAALWPV